MLNADDVKNNLNKIPKFSVNAFWSVLQIKFRTCRDLIYQLIFLILEVMIIPWQNFHAENNFVNGY